MKEGLQLSFSNYKYGQPKRLQHNGKMCNYNYYNCKIPVDFSSNKISSKTPPMKIPKKFSSTGKKVENHMPSEHVKNISEKLPGRFIKILILLQLESPTIV